MARRAEIPANDDLSRQARGWRAIFWNARELRAGWSFLLFAVLYLALGAGLTFVLRALLHELPEGWTPGVLSLSEAVSLLGAVAAVAVMARIERRSFAVYGVPWRAGLGRRVSGLALPGGALAGSALLWGLAFLLIGVSEEILFRSFPLFTLARGLGFWPGAIVFSAFFGALHYYTKPMETWMDGVSVGLIGLFLCLTVRRTGDVWFAAGFHFTWNFVSMALFGSPNTGNNGQPIPGHLLAGSFHGPAWLTGGPMGAEASACVFPVLALLFGLFLLRFRMPAFPAER
jgi:membrane protease YdiL (CAAX protease family)